MDADIWGDDDEAKQTTGATVIKTPINETNPFIDDDGGGDLSVPIQSTTLSQGALSRDSNLSTVSSPDGSDLTSYAQSTKSDTTSAAVRIVNTEERKAKLTKYTVYIIESGSNSVARRYNDFKWLYTALGAEFIFSIPSLPPSHSIKRFKDEVVAQRRYDLERFLNRIYENALLRGSAATESFLRQNDEQLFEEEKKSYKKTLQERSSHDTVGLLLKCYPNLENESIPEHLLGAQSDEDADRDLAYLLTTSSMPRVREFFMRCDERFDALNKTASALFKAFANISDELNVLNQSLGDLYDGESVDRPQCMSSYRERWSI